MDIYKTNPEEENTGLVVADNSGIAVIDSIDQHPVAVFLARQSEKSRRIHLQALNLIAGMLTGGQCDARTFNWAGIRYQHTQAVRSKLAESYSPSTARRMISALCGVITEAWRLGLISSEECDRAKDLAPIRGERLPRGRALTNGELRALFESCAKEFTTLNKRDAALLAILYGGGLRRSEAVALNIEDWNPTEGTLAIHRGKGNKARSVPLPDSAVPAIEAWISVRGEGSLGEPLIFPVNKGGKVIRRRMTDQAIMKALRTRALRSGVASFSPHDLRRSFVSDLLDNGADLSLAQQLAGHASPKTTARYDRRPEVAKKRAVNLIFVPIS